ncbi:MAG TPA: cytochrome C oxidase subunit II [Terriglobia bacterium]
MAALAVALVLILLTAISAGLFWGHAGWLPVDTSAHGPGVDHELNLTLLITGLLFGAAQLGLAYAVWKYRERGDGRKAAGGRGNGRLEAVWTLAVAALFVGLIFTGYGVWAQMYLSPAPAGALRIDVQGEQFAYSFRYPGPDGRFGPIHADKIDDAGGNPWGLDRDRDADSKDDVVTATLGIPVGRPVELLLRSRDVGHSFDVRELRIQQDMLPGVEIPVHFTATRSGQYEIICTQLCGLGHYRMRAFLRVLPEADFEEWLAEQASAQ